MNIKYKNISLILIILSGVFILLGSTFAYWTWNSTSNTSVSFSVTSNFSCSADGGGDINVSNLEPTDCTNSEHVIKRTITASTNSSTNLYMTLWLEGVNIPTEVSRSSNFRYVLTTNENSCTTDIVGSGTLLDGKTGSRHKLFINKEFSPSSTKTYYLYIWLDKEETNINTADKSFTLNLNGSCTDVRTPEPLAPVLDDGLIPVVFDTSGSNTLVKTISSSDSNWYDYDNAKWANAVLTTSTNRSTYKNNSGVTIPESEILAYYVWIPRYKYQIWYTGTANQTGQEQMINIIWDRDVSGTSKSLGTTVGSYLTHPAFTFGEKELSGIWVGKFETTGTGDVPTIKPNVQTLRNQNISNEFITSLKFAGGVLDNEEVTFSGSSYYGLSTNIDSHMAKNIEWAAVAYLSHSFYGKNSEVYINNSSYIYTGRSGGNVGGQTQVKDIYQDRTETSQYLGYGYYTWDGYLLNYNTNTKSDIRDLTKVASTTGNIYGVYDMSGGAWERVMGSLNNRSGNSTANNSGFTGLLEDGSTFEGIPFPPLKYYDLYTTTNRGTACNGVICLGHGLSEVAGWYNDYAYFVSTTYPWFNRGGVYNDGARAGAFYFSYSDGCPSSNFGARSVLSFVGA